MCGDVGSDYLVVSWSDVTLEIEPMMAGSLHQPCHHVGGWTHGGSNGMAK